MSPETVRHGALLAGCVAVALGVVYVAGGGFRDPPRRAEPTNDGDTGPSRDPGEEAHRTGDAGVGSGRGGRLEYDQVTHLPDRRVISRAYEVAYDTASPRESDDPENPDLIAENVDFAFFARPTPANPTPRAVIGPGATTVRADRADIVRREQGAHVLAHLRGNVVARHYDPAGAAADPGASTPPAHFLLESEALSLERAADEALRIESAVDVTVHHPEGHRMRGTGLRGDSGLGRLELLANVSGSFVGETLARSITCSGSGTIETLDTRPDVRPEERSLRRSTFRRDVRVEQGPETLTCTEQLILDTPFDPNATGGDAKLPPVSRMEAHGDVRIVGRYQDEPYSITCDKATSWTEREDHRVTLFEGGTEMVYEGLLGSSPAPGAAANTLPPPVRLTIRCAGPARLVDRPHPAAAFPGQRRFEMRFEKDVVVTREDPRTGTLLSRIEAPLVTLTGNWSESGGRDPQFLNAEDPETAGGGQRVHLVHTADGQSIDARAGFVTFFVMRDGARRIELGRSPRVTFEGARLPNPLGEAETTSGPPATAILACRENIEIIEAQLLPDGPQPPPDGLARVVKAKGQVRLSKVVGETQPLRLAAESLEIRMAWNRTILAAEAVGDARLEGRAEDGSGRRGSAHGHQITLTDLKRTEGGQTLSAARVLGRKDEPATAEIEDPGARSRHRLQAGTIDYAEGGTRLVAQRRAFASLSREPGATPESSDAMDEAGGRIEIYADRIVADLALPDDTTDRATRRELRRVEATGSTRLAARSGHTFVGDALQLDLVTGDAVATGRPARLEWARRGATSGPERPPSRVESPEIRATFTGTGRGELKSATCRGGHILGFHEASSGATADVQRVFVQATGPISVTPDTASARGDVEIRYDSLVDRRWTEDSRVTADSVDISFDRAAEGPAEGSIRHLLATGTSAAPVHFTSKQVDAIADRMESDGASEDVELTARAGRSVEVHSKKEGYRYRCTPGCKVNRRTLEWSSTGRSELILD